MSVLWGIVSLSLVAKRVNMYLWGSLADGATIVKREKGRSREGLLPAADFRLVLNSNMGGSAVSLVTACSLLLKT